MDLQTLPDLLRSSLKCASQLSAGELSSLENLANQIEADCPLLWKPFPGPQTMGYVSRADVTGYGGAAGGGKTDLALGLALTAHQHSLILRREAVNLRAIIDRAREILGNTGRLNENTGVWRGLPGGRQMEFGGCKNPGDEQHYRGRPHDLVVFDECDQFPEFMVRFIQGWLRTTIPGQRCRVVMSFNPPHDADGEWLLTYFAPWISDEHPNPAFPGEIRWFAMLDNREEEVASGEPFLHKGEHVQPLSRTFIPAKLDDNPTLRHTGYRATLQALPETLRLQLLNGDFRVGRQDDAWQCIPTAWVKAAQERWKASPRPELDRDRRMTALGVDVAHGGADSTAISARWGQWFAPTKKYQGQITDTGEKAAHLVMKEWKHDATTNVDAIGYGSGCHEELAKLIHHRAVAVNVARATTLTDRSGKYRLTNVRSAMYWKMREALDPVNGDNLMLPPEAELLADLCAPRYSVRASGIAVEAKEDLKKRIGRSPDVGDAVCLALWDTQPVWDVPTTAPVAEKREVEPRRINAMTKGRRLFKRT